MVTRDKDTPVGQLLLKGEELKKVKSFKDRVDWGMVHSKDIPKENIEIMYKTFLHTNPDIWSRVVGHENIAKRVIVIDKSKFYEVTFLSTRMGVTKRDRMRNNTEEDRLKEELLQERK